MKSVETILSKVEVLSGGKVNRELDYNVRKFYQKEGKWYAVVQLWVNDSVASLHVALE